MQKSDMLFLDENTAPALMYLAEGMPGGFFVYEARGEERLLYYNSALMRIFGCETREEFEELTGNTFKGIVYEEDYELVEESIWRQIANSKNDLDFVEYRIRRKDGQLRWIEDYGHYKIMEPYGEIFYVFVQDNTERMVKRVKKLENMNAELTASNKRVLQFKKAIMYDAISFLEINLTKNEFITSSLPRMNTAMEELHGNHIPQFKSYTEYVDYLISHAAEEEKEEYKNFFDIKRLIHCCNIGELEQIYETWSVDFFGRKRLYKYLILLGVDEKTDDVVALAIAKDITDQLERQRLLEMALVQANAASIARQTFLSSMSHDIRTPLNSIIGFTDLIKSNITDAQKTIDYAEKIRKSGEQLLSIVNESLELTRIESGKVELDIKPGNILDVLEDVKKRFLPEFIYKNLTFSIVSEHITHADVFFDVIRFREVLCQLVDNAVKYTHDGGEIILEAKELPTKVKDHAKFRFSVRDNGIGIGEEFMEKIFDSFEREHNTTSSGVIGSGLGLAVVKNIVDMMDGTVQVESKVSEGSTFTVTVSFALLQSEESKEEIMPKGNEVVFAGKKILLVEDNEINLEIAKELLEESEFVVDTAENGFVAVKMVEDNPPHTYDLILMDIQMPVMDGYQATRAIRELQDKEKASIPIIAVSANAFAEDKERSLAAGMNAHCPKPIEIAYLKELIAKELGNTIQK